MNIQGALTDLMKVFLAFYIGCSAVGRSDIPFKMIAQLRTEASKGANSKGWGCPSIFNRRCSCKAYDHRNYK